MRAVDAPAVAASHTRAHAAVASSVAFWGVAAWLLVAPFEGRHPLLQLPGQSLSSVEVALFSVFAIWAGAALWSRRLPRWRTSLTAPAFGFLSVAIVAALLAPIDRANAVHMAGRFLVAFGVFLVTVNGVTSPERLRALAAISAISGALIAALAILEFLGVAPILSFLTFFRSGLALVGTQPRAGGPFQYPTIASMYLEILFAIGLGLLPILIDTRRRFAAAALIAVLALIAEAVSLTFTRAGFITLVTSAAIVGAIRVRACGFDAGARAIAIVALLLFTSIVASRSANSLLLRMTSEDSGGWYLASVDAPSNLQLATGSVETIPVTVSNVGRATWEHDANQPFLLSYHWLADDSDRVVVFEGVRTPLPDVSAGSSVSMQARVRAPVAPGSYRLMWDILREHRLWFSTAPEAETTISKAVVSGPARGSVSIGERIALPKVVIRPPGRGVLWAAAGRMIAAHPLLGIGPDNFRLSYGPFAHLQDADPRVHTNNTYLEILVGGGVLLGAAFAWCAWNVFGVIRALAAALRAPSVMPAAGVMAAVFAMAIHGLVDAFLSFTATYVLFAIVFGLAVASRELTASYAHRI
jgi:hypothetical protein